MNKILIIGGAGYIGSNMAHSLVEKGLSTVVFDNLATGHRPFVPKKAAFVKGDLRKASDVKSLFSKHKFEAIMHFGASSLVGESVENPLKYYENNVLAAVNLLQAVEAKGVSRFIFSSTAAVYGEPERVPIREEDATKPTNPYGHSKLMIEKMLEDLSRKGMFRYAALRYFNACGANPSRPTGEWHDPETHLIPNILKVAAGKKKELLVFGDDYPTPDGTCVRDYIHIDDLADGHLAALDWLGKSGSSGVFNLGNGDGYSVNQIIQAAERVTGKKITRRVVARRPGDPAKLVADASKAKQILNWKAKRDLDAIVGSAWAWETKS